MKHLTSCALLLLPIAAAPACGGKKVMVPPRIDLQRHEVLAIIEFRSNKEGELASLATTRFLEYARLDQGLVRIVQLGPEAEALKQIDRQRLDRSAFQELGRAHDVATIFTGELEVSRIRPAISISSDLGSLGAAADVDAVLTVEMVDAASGASIWSRSASVTKRVGQVSLLGGSNVVFDADDPERAYGELVDALVEAVTWDFRVSWARG